MANPPPTNPTPVTFDTFMADRQNMWAAFTGFTVYSVVFLVILLALMAFFLL